MRKPIQKGRTTPARCTEATLHNAPRRCDLSSFSSLLSFQSSFSPCQPLLPTQGGTPTSSFIPSKLSFDVFISQLSKRDASVHGPRRQHTLPKGDKFPTEQANTLRTSRYGSYTAVFTNGTNPSSKAFRVLVFFSTKEADRDAPTSKQVADPTNYIMEGCLRKIVGLLYLDDKGGWDPKSRWTSIENALFVQFADSLRISWH